MYRFMTYEVDEIKVTYRYLLFLSLFSSMSSISLTRAKD